MGYPVGKHHSRNPLEKQQMDSMGKPRNRNLLESITEGSYWKASQQDSFGKHHTGILLESITTGILWKAPHRDSIGKPHNRNPLESISEGAYWNLKASQKKYFGKH